MRGTLRLTSIPNLYLLLEAPHPKTISANRDSPNCTYYCDIHPHLVLLPGLPPESAPVPRPFSASVYVMRPSHPYLYLLLGLLSVPIMGIPIHIHTWYWDPHRSLYPLPGPLSISIHIMGPLIHTCTLGPVPIPITGTLTHTSPCYWEPCLYVLSGSHPYLYPLPAFSLVPVMRSSPVPVTVNLARPGPAGTWWVRSAVQTAPQSCRTTRPVPASTNAVATCAPVPRSPDTSTADPGNRRAPPPNTYLRVPAGAVSGGRHRRPAPCAALPRSCGAAVPGTDPRTHSCREYRNLSSLPTMTAPPTDRPAPPQGGEPIPWGYVPTAQAWRTLRVRPRPLNQSPEATPRGHASIAHESRGGPAPRCPRCGGGEGGLAGRGSAPSGSLAPGTPRPWRRWRRAGSRRGGRCPRWAGSWPPSGRHRTCGPRCASCCCSGWASACSASAWPGAPTAGRWPRSATGPAPPAAAPPAPLPGPRPPGTALTPCPLPARRDATAPPSGTARPGESRPPPGPKPLIPPLSLRGPARLPPRPANALGAQPDERPLPSTPQ